eukprot:5914486-Alexandrium_andersonii.AAC.1
MLSVHRGAPVPARRLSRTARSRKVSAATRSASARRPVRVRVRVRARVRVCASHRKAAFSAA